MNMYLWLKLIHIVGATLVLGTGLGIAFFMWRAYLSRSAEAMEVTARSVVLADWVFTTSAIVIQFVTGIWLTSLLGIAYGSIWFITVIGIFVLVGLCWIPVVFIQIRIRKILADGGSLAECGGLMKIWMSLGVPAFLGVLLLIYLMVSKHGASTIIFA